MFELLLGPELVFAYGLNRPHNMKLSLNGKLIVNLMKINKMFPKEFSSLKEIFPKVLNFTLRANKHDNKTIIGGSHIYSKQIHNFIRFRLNSFPIVLTHQNH